jgi:hypothetical protein
MSQRRFRFRPQLEAMEDRLCPSSTVVLPISAFLAQQGHDSVFTPPVRDQEAWSNSVFDPGTGIPTRDLLVDYTGQEAQFLLAHGINLHTSVSGFVTETPIAGTNLMEVTVNLEATNALTWVANIANVNPNQPDGANTAPIELGYRAQELVDNPSLPPALSSVQFQLTWQQQAGTTLPDLARLNENFALYAPPEFSFERFDVQSYGTGVLRAATTVGTPGQTAIVFTSQVADLTNPNLPGTLGDGFWHEGIDIVPVASASTHVAYLNGTVMVNDTSNSNDSVQITPTANGGAQVTSNLGNGTFANVTAVVVSLGGGNNSVQIGNLPGATVDVIGLDGNSHVAVGDTGKLVVHVGQGNNHIDTGNTTLAAQFIGVGGNGNNQIDLGNTASAEILMAGNGNNHIAASGADDFIEVLGNGNNHVQDTGTGDLVWLGGDGNNDILNDGTDSLTDILGGTGHNHITGRCRMGSARAADIRHGAAYPE